MKQSTDLLTDEDLAVQWAAGRNQPQPKPSLLAATHAAVQRDAVARLQRRQWASVCLTVAAIAVAAVAFLARRADALPTEQESTLNISLHNEEKPALSAGAVRAQAIAEQIQLMRQHQHRPIIFESRSYTHMDITAVRARIAAVPPFNPWKEKKP